MRPDDVEPDPPKRVGDQVWFEVCRTYSDQTMTLEQWKKSNTHPQTFMKEAKRYDHDE